jgi:hypothetical protein
MEKETDVSEGAVAVDAEFIALTDLQITPDEEQLTATVEPEPPGYQSVVPMAEGQTAGGNAHHINQNQNVIVEQPRTHFVETVVVRPPEAADWAIVWSILVLLFCAPPCGVISLVFAIMAKVYYSDGERVLGSQFVKCSNVVNIIGVAVGMLTFISVMTVMIIFISNNMPRDR